MEKSEEEKIQKIMDEIRGLIADNKILKEDIVQLQSKKEEFRKYIKHICTRLEWQENRMDEYEDTKDCKCHD